MACAAAAVLPACAGGSHSANKAGASVEHHVTLRLEMPDTGDPRGTFFAQAVARRSHGSVRVRIDMTRYSNVRPGNELALARALESGHEDIAYLPARAWAAARLPAFRALLAPFVITTEHASQNVANAPVAQQILATLPKSVVGIALVPDQARRVLADRPVTSLAAFSGMRIRIVATHRAPRTLPPLAQYPCRASTPSRCSAAIEADEVDAVEASTHTILVNTYFARARHLSAYSIFPKFQSIVVSRRAWVRLSPAQRQAIRAAAADTIAASERQIALQDQKELGVTVPVAGRALVRERFRTERPGRRRPARGDVARAGRDGRGRPRRPAPRSRSRRAPARNAAPGLPAGHGATQLGFAGQRLRDHPERRLLGDR